MEPLPRLVTRASSVAVESDLGSSNPDPEPPLSPVAVHSVPWAPPGLPPPPTYQRSTQARELLDDVRARREQVTGPRLPSPFLEFVRTLDSLGGGDFSFKWTLDPKVTPSDPNAGTQEYVGSFDLFGASGSVSMLQQQGQCQFLQLSGAPSLPLPSASTIPPAQQARGYHSSFNPFADVEDESAPPLLQPCNGDGGRQESRFGFHAEGHHPRLPPFDLYVWMGRGRTAVQNNGMTRFNYVCIT
jgi:CCR4-NOT transcription complex subunit 4